MGPASQCFNLIASPHVSGEPLPLEPRPPVELGSLSSGPIHCETAFAATSIA
jgi:hypothetical protein